MVVERLLSEEVGPIEGIVDTGVVIGHFEAREVTVVNPLPQKLFLKYNKWLKEKLGGQKSSTES